jgi:PQQ-dependent catabolism-associated CXXCW motif protein
MAVPGAKTVTTAEIYGMLVGRQPMVLLYVSDLYALSIAGAHWLYRAGKGESLDDAVQVRLVQKADQLSSGDKNAPVVAFSDDSHCWLSYNTALRLVRGGYRNVVWYRGGIEAWKAAGLPTATLAQEAW